MNMDISFLQAQQLQTYCNMPLIHLKYPSFTQVLNNILCDKNLIAVICSKHGKIKRNIFTTQKDVLHHESLRVSCKTRQGTASEVKFRKSLSNT